MKKISLILLLTSLFFTLNSFAQEGPDQRMRGPGPEQQKAQMEKMIADLDLSDDQSEAMKEIMKDYRGKMRNVRDESNGDRMAMREDLEALNDERNAELQTLLTEAQYNTHLQNEAERRKHLWLKISDFFEEN